jgi:hypothetical protein
MAKLPSYIKCIISYILNLFGKKRMSKVLKAISAEKNYNTYLDLSK